MGAAKAKNSHPCHLSTSQITAITRSVLLISPKLGDALTKNSRGRPEHNCLWSGRSVFPRPGDAQSNVRRLPALSFPSTWCTAINWCLAQLGAAGALALCNQRFHRFFLLLVPTFLPRFRSNKVKRFIFSRCPFKLKLCLSNQLSNGSNT